MSPSSGAGRHSCREQENAAHNTFEAIISTTDAQSHIHTVGSHTRHQVAQESQAVAEQSMWNGGVHDFADYMKSSSLLENTDAPKFQNTTNAGG